MPGTGIDQCQGLDAVWGPDLSSHAVEAPVFLHCAAQVLCAAGMLAELIQPDAGQGHYAAETA